MSPGAPLVSILVPSFDAARYLPELCSSFQAQSYANFEVLILDDGSADETNTALAPFRNDSRFRTFGWTPNRGVNAATSALLGLMKGDYWCNPGADDVLLPDFLARRVEWMESNRNAVIVHGPPQFIDSSGQPTDRPESRLDLPLRLPGPRALAVLLQHNVIGTTSVMARSSLTRLVLHLFLRDWKYAQDWFLWILHAATGFDLLWDNQPLHKYRVHELSLSLEPRLTAIRRAETRLVPLCALSAAAGLSPLAAPLWANWRKALYRLWLLRAAKMRRQGVLQPDWLQTAADAYYGKRTRHVSLAGELCRHGLGMLLAAFNESRALKTQTFRVSGLAQINDPIFR
ncbi:hypothetical protein SBV1_590021 [Verrucomicrobia bacterium]|nr:hypothetical protein SBV1_590021 [Verrucomicrobiota bacterium]